MQRVTRFVIDHFGFATMHESESVDFFKSIGFHIGDERPKGAEGLLWMSHVYFDYSSYFNIVQLPNDGNSWPCTLDFVYDDSLPSRRRLSDPRGVDGVYTFVYSTVDADASHEAAVDAGYSVFDVSRRGDSAIPADQLTPEFEQACTYYNRIGGSCTSDMFAFKLDSNAAFPNMMLGVMEHGDKDHKHLFRKNIHEYHPNGVNKIKEFILYYETEDELLDALKDIQKIDDALYPYIDHVIYHTDQVRLLDKKGYVSYFQKEAPTGIRSNIVGVVFENGDHDYLKETFDKNQNNYWEINGKLFLDVRDLLNVVFIFE